MRSLSRSLGALAWASAALACGGSTSAARSSPASSSASPAATSATASATAPGRTPASPASSPTTSSRRPVPRSVASTRGSDPTLRARILAAAEGAFPAKPAPSLSGPLHGIAFGAGKHLLDCSRADLEPLARKSKPNADVQLLPTELSGGNIPLSFRFAGERLERYSLGIDYTYAREARAGIERAIDAHFGASTPEPQTFDARECRRFAPTKDGVHARVCNVRSQLQVTIAGDAASL